MSNTHIEYNMDVTLECINELKSLKSALDEINVADQTIMSSGQCATEMQNALQALLQYKKMLSNLIIQSHNFAACFYNNVNRSEQASSVSSGNSTSSSGNQQNNSSTSTETEKNNYDSTSTTGSSTSDQGVDFIKRYEGFSNTPYDDGSGNMTIGYGHVIANGENYTYISESEAKELLAKQIRETFEVPLNKFLEENGIIVNQAQYDALLSFAYNCGQNVWFRNGEFTLRNLLLQYKDASKIPAEDVYYAFGLWNKSGGKVLQGLVNRRNAEAELFINGTY